MTPLLWPSLAIFELGLMQLFGLRSDAGMRRSKLLDGLWDQGGHGLPHSVSATQHCPNNINFHIHEVRIQGGKSSRALADPPPSVTEE